MPLTSYRLLIVSVALLLLGGLLPGSLEAHGVEVLVKQQPPCIIIRVFYHGGRGLKNARATVRLENDTDIFQTGQTDQNGVFSFIPDRSGKWLITVDDGLGHMKKAEVEAGTDFFELPTEAAPSTAPLEKTTAAHNGSTAPGNASPAASAPQAQPEPNTKEPNAPPGVCCFLLKILLGVLFILGVTLLMKKLAGKKP